MSRRESRNSLGARSQSNALEEFENFKKKYLLVNKHIAKLNSSLNVRIEELTAQVAALNIDNLRLRASELSLARKLQREKDKSTRILHDAETAIINQFNALRMTYGMSHTLISPASASSTSPVDRPLAYRPKARKPPPPDIPRLSRAPEFGGISEASEDEPHARSPVTTTPYSTSSTPARRKHTPRSNSSGRTTNSSSTSPGDSPSTPCPPRREPSPKTLNKEDSSPPSDDEPASNIPHLNLTRKPGRRQSGLVMTALPSSTQQPSVFPIPRVPVSLPLSPRRAASAVLATRNRLDFGITGEEETPEADADADELDDTGALEFTNTASALDTPAVPMPPLPPLDTLITSSVSVMDLIAKRGAKRKAPTDEEGDREKDRTLAESLRDVTNSLSGTPTRGVSGTRDTAVDISARRMGSMNTLITTTGGAQNGLPLKPRPISLERTTDVRPTPEEGTPPPENHTTQPKPPPVSTTPRPPKSDVHVRSAMDYQPFSETFNEPRISSTADVVDSSETEGGRRARVRKSVNYAEPSLKIKMRKPDHARTSYSTTNSEGGWGEAVSSSSVVPRPPKRKKGSISLSEAALNEVMSPSISRPQSTATPSAPGLDVISLPRMSTTTGEETFRERRPPSYREIDDDAPRRTNPTSSSRKKQSEDDEGGFDADEEYVPISSSRYSYSAGSSRAGSVLSGVGREREREKEKERGSQSDPEGRRHSIAV